ncbi:MAG: hypothetical protein HFI05_16020, partial [Lachnospiraceae bacterium]|nr:hypothetical protein [Lachnospiraceae bacterium]
PISPGSPGQPGEPASPLGSCSSGSQQQELYPPDFVMFVYREGFDTALFVPDTPLNEG